MKTYKTYMATGVVLLFGLSILIYSQNKETPAPITTTVSKLHQSGSLQATSDNPVDVVEQRIELMQTLQSAMQKLAPLIMNPRMANAEGQVHAKKILEASKKIINLFPQGSLSDSNKADPEIWQSWAEFERLAKRLEGEAETLVDTLAVGSAAAGSTQGAFGGIPDVGPQSMPSPSVITPGAGISVGPAMPGGANMPNRMGSFGGAPMLGGPQTSMGAHFNAGVSLGADGSPVYSANIQYYHLAEACNACHNKFLLQATPAELQSAPTEKPGE